MTGRVTIFGNGKMISVGTKTTLGSFRELDKAVQILKAYELVKSKRITPKVRNIVALLSLRIKIDIEKLARSIPKSIYEQEQFPGLIIRIPTVGTYLVFSSGKIIINRVNSESKLNHAVFEIRQRLEKLGVVYE